MKFSTRLLALQNQLKSLFKTATKTPKTEPKNRKFSAVSTRCDAHMDELPIPCGSWDDYYKERNSKYNLVLALGAGWFLLSFVIFQYTGCCFWNWGPPDRPGPPVDIDTPKIECRRVT